MAGRGPSGIRRAASATCAGHLTSCSSKSKYSDTSLRMPVTASSASGVSAVVTAELETFLRRSCRCLSLACPHIARADGASAMAHTESDNHTRYREDAHGDQKPFGKMVFRERDYQGVHERHGVKTALVSATPTENATRAGTLNVMPSSAWRVAMFVRRRADRAQSSRARALQAQARLPEQSVSGGKRR